MTGTRVRIKLLIVAAVLCAAAVLWLSRSDRNGSVREDGGAETAASPVDALSWLAGCWKLEEPEFRREEQWMRPAGGTLVGMSRSVADGKTVEYEYLRIEARDERLVYVASPSGQAETVFTLEELTDRSVSFTAPEHDFPQRIVYERMSPRSILAWIDGEVDGVSRVVEFPMVSAHCP
jgi:hypothetical protein